MSALHPPTAVLTEEVDARAGVVRAAGVLTGPGADLLRGTVETLHRQGHRSVVLDLSGVHAAEDDGLAALDRLRATSAAGGRPVLTVRGPAWEDR